MRIEVRLFGGLTERAGTSRTTVEVADDADVAALRAALAAAHPNLAGLLPSANVAVDLEVADDHRALAGAREIAVLPPVAGGAGDVPPANAPSGANDQARAEHVSGTDEQARAENGLGADEQARAENGLGADEQARAENVAGGAGDVPPANAPSGANEHRGADDSTEPGTSPSDIRIEDRDGVLVATGLVMPPFDVDAVTARIISPGVGGTAMFLGTVRDHASDLDGVVALEYSAYPAMAHKVLGELATALCADHPKLAGIALLHAVGELPVGAHTVLIVCAAAHRGAAFDACRDALERVKDQVPIWKREITADGAHRWVGLPPKES